jgi:hypothetical protein
MKQDETTVTANGGVNRRDFLKLGTGLVVYFWAGPMDVFGQAPPAVSTDFNAYIQIGANGRVTCMVGKI